MKKRKSSGNLKMKIFSSYINSKKFATDIADKEKIL